MSIKRPVNQVKLTNVAVVRMRRKGKRFELACYKNKVMAWRRGIEKEIDEVLQIHSIFENVSKGVQATKVDLDNCFDTLDEDEIIRLILEKGEVQIAEKERKLDLESKFRDVATIIHEKSVNEETGRPFPVAFIDNALHEIHFSVSSNRSAKQLALQAIPLLAQSIPIVRAKMRLRVRASKQHGKLIKTELEGRGATFEECNWLPDLEGVILIEPGLFREVEEFIREKTRGSGSVDVLDVQVQPESDDDDSKANMY